MVFARFIFLPIFSSSSHHGAVSSSAFLQRLIAIRKELMYCIPIIASEQLNICVRICRHHRYKSQQDQVKILSVNLIP